MSAGTGIPRGQGARVRDFSAMKPADPSHPTRILLVEDNEDDVFLSKRALTKAGLTAVFHVGDGRAAMDYLAGHEAYADRARYPLPDLVLLDLKMPGYFGHEVLEWIRRQLELKDLKVYVLTSSDELRDRSRVEQAGVAGYFVKPLSASHLEEILRKS